MNLNESELQRCHSFRFFSSSTSYFGETTSNLFQNFDSIHQPKLLENSRWMNTCIWETDDDDDDDEEEGKNNLLRLNFFLFFISICVLWLKEERRALYGPWGSLIKKQEPFFRLHSRLWFLLSSTTKQDSEGEKVTRRSNDTNIWVSRDDWLESGNWVLSC